MLTWNALTRALKCVQTKRQNQGNVAEIFYCVHLKHSRTKGEGRKTTGGESCTLVQRHSFTPRHKGYIGHDTSCRLHLRKQKYSGKYEGHRDGNMNTQLQFRHLRAGGIYRFKQNFFLGRDIRFSTDSFFRTVK